ncbi:2-succinyl-5-enolpyruvyl-6-hydroxy-3-cyclohexene-1-carboxylic-acid synthase [Gordonibacter urolithinfaciens]|uniref:2-succinyl-5-enolpyruvyl-6-hydroxy-3- cyclohexene-1-carboxylic-acid synthase n=1 Tax=Gordonibacter urolithinfaciens TaxID=1335613 RepID=UPI000F4D0155|nr:2-succinyl-5-enolpyruvyl-6-hydroxy-3-cyclohexene-1-carboxylic-acid synthase [Gordonibacter urolithinfaciens]ROT93106.1 2-succinyl-5-enolpyruvyl-6-hydroxy-3-cyclohexene-1-carboxylic-acid synthase [Gordonibacter urolithinfaciens]
MTADPQATALFLGAFFDELARWGVRDVVVSPGSRSTPLSMTAFELSRRAPERMRLFVDVDERGAAFFALGLAKASGRPAALVCTSGSAVANYYPAVMEAESSRVPLVVLTGDRPPRLQGLGAPQTCDQLNAYGNHVRAFRQMPLPSGDDAALAFARQAAREAVIAAGEGCFGGPVHLNFPFDEPLKPDLGVEGLFESARRADVSRETSVPVARQLAPAGAEHLAALFAGKRALVFAGEGTCTGELEAGKVLNWARAFRLPLLADPLSGLRSSDDPLVIDNYDSVLGPGGTVPDGLAPEVVVRFGRYPVSKKATQLVAAARPVQIVVDPLETRDCNAATDVFVRCRPSELAGSLGFAYDVQTIDYEPDDVQRAFARAWIDANDAARERIAAVDDVEAGFEGAFVRRVVELAPEGSCLFAANSMSVRALDTFYVKEGKRLTVLCNRGLNGIDGTVSTALGAAQHFAQTTFVTGDLTLLHDLNALALQRELRVQREMTPCAFASSDTASREAAGAATPGAAADTAPGNAEPGTGPSIVIVLLNNNGGGIFDMLPQKSEDPYFERLFLTPQDVDFQAAAQAFGVPYRAAGTVEAFDEAYRELLGTPGISLIEVRVPLVGLKERYAPYW